MKIDVNYSEKVRGLLFKTTYPTVSFDIYFDPEELSLLKQEEHQMVTLADVTYCHPWDEVQAGSPVYIFQLTVSHEKDKVLSYHFDRLSEAKTFEQLFLRGLKQLKGYIEDNSGVSESEKSRSYEI